MVVVVTGASGQMGQAIRQVSSFYDDIHFIFLSRSDADITNRERLLQILSSYKPDYCINAAAYTAVDRAESEPDLAYLINAVGAGNVAWVCETLDVTLIQLSTDFVFDGSKNIPYREDDDVNPLSVYGTTKLQGERNMAVCRKHFIIRSSWIYSEFGSNFYKTMLRLAGQGNIIRVVNDQTGTPTNATDLSHALISIIRSGSTSYGIYHYSNEGQATWFEFAQAIFKKQGIRPQLVPTSTKEFGAPAQRPSYSVLDKSKVKSTFGLEIPHWKESL